ncbi:MAG: hypothetical protein INQ03_06730 [Candidatus Heimdallarchaeota archaeon]|nr:hypothetical protein [Candidatus Heimdallarchaeota archaeon]
MTYQRRKKEPLEIEAELFSAVATLDQLSKYFDKGLVEGTLYKRQLKSCIADVFKSRIELEKMGFDIHQFIEREQLLEKYPEGLRRLNLVEGLSSEDTTLSFETIKDLPRKSADYVANAIELIDVLKLRSIAKVEYIIPPLDEMLSIIKEFPNFSDEHWIYVEIDGWRVKLLDEKPSKTLSDEMCEKLEFDAARWLNEFRRNLKEL